MGYSSNLKNQSFWFQESKKTANYMLEGLTRDEISKIVVDENIYQVVNPERSSEIFNNIYKRLHFFPNDLLEYFLKIDVDSAKIFVLITIMRSDDLFFEFMNDIFKDHLILGNYNLEHSDVFSFLQKKQLDSEKIANWSELTLKRLSTTSLTMLLEAGIYDKKNNQILIPFIDPQLVKLLKDEGFGSYIETIEI